MVVLLFGGSRAAVAPMDGPLARHPGRSRSRLPAATFRDEMPVLAQLRHVEADALAPSQYLRRTPEGDG